MARESTERRYIGKRFGKLVVKSCFINENKRLMCDCLCDCGNIACVYAYNLRKKFTKSCGCVRKKVVGLRSKTISKIKSNKVIRYRKAGMSFEKIADACGLSKQSAKNICDREILNGKTKAIRRKKGKSVKRSKQAPKTC